MSLTSIQPHTHAIVTTRDALTTLPSKDSTREFQYRYVRRIIENVQMMDRRDGNGKEEEDEDIVDVWSLLGQAL